MQIGLGIGAPFRLKWVPPLTEQIRSLLFGSGEQGAWYDPADLSTLFQDTAGTVPVTAVEQAVALMLDKSGRGNHASQATSTKRFRYSRRVNLLTKTEDFSDAAWSKLSGTTATINKIVAGTTPGAQGSWMGISTTVGNLYTVKLRAKAAEYSTLSISDNAFSRFALTINLLTGVVIYSNLIVGLPRITIDEGGWVSVELDMTATQVLHRVNVTGVPPSAYSQLASGVSFAGDGASGVLVEDPSYSLAIDSHLPYQRVNTATDYDADPNKFPAYLADDGIDDGMQTGNIDFTGTDKMTVWAGVTKLSDAAVGVVTEFGTSLPPGGFYVAAPNSVGPTFGFASKGTVPASPTPSGHAAPKNAVLTGIGDIGADIATCRVNRVSTTLNSDQGTGNYGNYPLYIGARAGTSLFFNGRLYSLIVRGAQSSLSQIEAAELYTRRRMMLP